MDILELTQGGLRHYADRVDGLSSLLHSYQRILRENPELFDDVQCEQNIVTDALILCRGLRNARNKAERDQREAARCARAARRKP